MVFKRQAGQFQSCLHSAQVFEIAAIGGDDGPGGEDDSGGGWGKMPAL
jgi:hypothetical protein